MKKQLDMRTRIAFPARPTCSQDLRDPAFEPWHFACALAGNYTARQFCAYRKVCLLIGDPRAALDVIDGVRDVLDHAHDIKSPAAFLMNELQLAAGGREI